MRVYSRHPGGLLQVDGSLERLAKESELLRQAYGHFFDLTVVNNDIEDTIHTLEATLDTLDASPQWLPVAWVYWRSRRRDGASTPQRWTHRSAGHSRDQARHGDRCLQKRVTLLNLPFCFFYFVSGGGVGRLHHSEDSLALVEQRPLIREVNSPFRGQL